MPAPGNDPLPTSAGKVNVITGQTLPQEGPFDFQSPVQKGRPEVPFHFPYGQPEADEYTAEQRERGQQCGRALLERAMLGPPLQEGDKACGSTGTR